MHEIAGANDRALLDVAVAAEVNLVGDPALAAAEAAREAGNAPNSVMAAAAAIIGPKRVERALACTQALIDLFAHSGLRTARDENFDPRRIKIDAETRALFLATEAEQDDPRPEAMIGAIAARGAQVGVPEAPRELRRAAVARRGACGDRDDDRLGAADAQAHLPAHGARPCPGICGSTA